MATLSANLAGDVAIFRRFNRMYTRFIGTLNEGLLNSEFSLAEARVLYELATREAPKAGEIADELGIDAGYLSRLVAKFERDGLLKRKTSEQDGRYADIVLTGKGRTAFKKLNALSEEQAKNVLEGLSPSAKTQLIDCMRTIEGVLSKKNARRVPYILRPHRVGDMGGWCIGKELAMQSSMAGMRPSKPWWRGLSISFLQTSIRAENAAGLPRSMVRTLGIFFLSNIQTSRIRRS